MAVVLAFNFPLHGCFNLYGPVTLIQIVCLATCYIVYNYSRVFTNFVIVFEKHGSKKPLTLCQHGKVQCSSYKSVLQPKCIQ